MYCPYLGTQQRQKIVDIPIKLAQKLATSCFLKILSACYVFRNWDTAVVWLKIDALLMQDRCLTVASPKEAYEMGVQKCSEKNSDTVLNRKQDGTIPEHAKDLLQHKIKIIEIMSTVRRTRSVWSVLIWTTSYLYERNHCYARRVSVWSLDLK